MTVTVPQPRESGTKLQKKQDTGLQNQARQALLLTVKSTELQSARSRQLNPVTRGQAEGQAKPDGQQAAFQELERPIILGPAACPEWRHYLIARGPLLQTQA